MSFESYNNSAASFVNLFPLWPWRPDESDARTHDSPRSGGGGGGGSVQGRPVTSPNPRHRSRRDHVTSPGPRTIVSDVTSGNEPARAVPGTCGAAEFPRCSEKWVTGSSQERRVGSCFQPGRRRCRRRPKENSTSMPNWIRDHTLERASGNRCSFPICRM